MQPDPGLPAANAHHVGSSADNVLAVGSSADNVLAVGSSADNVEHAGHLADNVLHFGRLLRQAGMPIPTDRIQLALSALQIAGLESKRDFHDTLAACFIDRAEHRALFEQAFWLYWRDPDVAGRMMAMLLPRVQTKTETPPAPENRRLGEALFPHPPQAPKPAPQEQIEVDASLTWNEREVLRKADFDTMSADEWRQAQRLLRQLAPLFEPLRTRRHV
ncbi:MAG: hypothetical protein LH480_14815, partial [Rubrivivax sp.]|nr:hypothetical protein [Rubrivivax sp.]